MIKYASFRSNNDEDVTFTLNKMREEFNGFTVISIHQVQSSWVVFYSRLITPEASAKALMDTLNARTPPDSSWVEFTDVPKPWWKRWKR